MLQEKDKAPVFKGNDQNNNTVTSKKFNGKKWVLYFYPQDMTETCTVQACNIRDNYDLLTKNGISIIGISPDPIASHKKFELKHQLPFPLISDIDHTIINAFGVWGEKQMFGKKYLGLIRTTFLIDEKGIIRKVISKPKSKQHAQEILDSWKIIT